MSDILEADDLAYLREEIGSSTPPTDADLQTIFLRVGSVEAVAASVVRGRLADLLASPGRLTDQGTTIDNTANILALRMQLERLEGVAYTSGPTATGADLTTGLASQQMVRTESSWR